MLRGNTMSKINVFVSLLLAAVMPSALGQSSPLTVQEWTNLQSEIKRAEARNKLNSGVPARIARTCDDELAMYAVFGVGSKLRADFGFRGTTATLAPGENAELGGWYVEELTPSRAVMVKRSGKKVISRCPVYL